MDLFIYVLWLGPSLGTVVCLFMFRPLPPYSAFGPAFVPIVFEPSGSYFGTRRLALPSVPSGVWTVLLCPSGSHWEAVGF